MGLLRRNIGKPRINRRVINPQPTRHSKPSPGGPKYIRRQNKK